MNKKKIYKWLHKKAADTIGEEELQSLKNDLVNPVKIAAKEALDDIISDYDQHDERLRWENMPSEEEMRKHRCCFTGHRPEKLAQPVAEVRQWLTTQIKKALDDGYFTFITGMSIGVEIWAGEIVTALRKEDSRIHLIAVVPWPGFSNRWSPEWKKRYEDLIARADLVKYSCRNYAPSVFSMRNMWMVDHSARVIAYYSGADGGTKEMISYARDKGLDVIVGGDTPPKVKAPAPVIVRRGYPLNMLDAIMDCETYQDSKAVNIEDLPADFDSRLKKAVSTIKDDRAYDYLIGRYRDGCTLQSLADRDGLSRERIRQLLEKYIKRLRNPDIVRFLNCGVENIPEKS